MKYYRWSLTTVLVLGLTCVTSACLFATPNDERPKPENYDQWRDALEAEAATAAENLQALPNFEVELLRSARPEEGSWISMAFDPAGRLTISREDQGLSRLIIPDIAIDPRFDVSHPPVVPSQEDDDDEAYDPFFLRTVEGSLKECRGLLYAYDALYANANKSKGLYRLRDRNRDGKFEEVTLLKATPGGVGHGRNDLTLGPDGLIYSIHGNDVELPKDFELQRSPYRNYQVDALLPCEWNKFLFNAGATLPAGHLVRTDAEGERWEIVAGGMRNPYGVAFNADGEAFTYDADMEWDAGAPWYRPTRVNHLVSGADFGWRQGTGKWPAWMPESLPATVDIGLGSPTAVEFGTKSNFPAKYRDALFINEWAYGRIIAVHLTPSGASYQGELETFVLGRPLNVTDLTFGPDGHLYFITGGRKTQSGLYRVRYVGPISESDPKVDQQAAVARAERRKLEEFHGTIDERAVDIAWDYLDHDDVFLRHAARIAIEAQPVKTWRMRALKERRPTAGLTALLALARLSTVEWQSPIVDNLAEFPLDKLTPQQRLIALRTYQLCFTRMGPPNAQEAIDVALRRVAPHFPSDDPRADRLACELLVYLKSPTVIAKTVSLLESDRSETEKLHYLFCLRHVKTGWTTEQRETFFRWLRKARGFEGAHYVPRFVHYIEQDALSHLNQAEREAMLPILNAKIDQPVVDLGADRDVVKNWKLIDFVFDLNKVDQERDLENGLRMFKVARCSACHKLGGDGHALGPDLTDVAKRFNRRDLLVSILSPSTVIADKYKTTQFTTSDGKIISGLVISEDDTQLQISADPLHPQMLTTLAKEDIESQTPSTVSTMPEDLLNRLTKEEVLDLLAYLEAQR